MKRLIIILIGVAMTCLAFAQQHKNGWMENNLKGQVKSFMEIYYSIDSSGLMKPDEIMEVNSSEFDEKGYLIKENATYPHLNNSTSRKTYSYDEKGNRLGVFYHDSIGIIVIKEIFKYDNAGNEISWIFYNSDTVTENERKVTKYGKNLKIVNDYWNRTTVPSSIDSMQLDTNGNCIEEIAYKENGEYIGKTINKYDSKGNLLETSQYNERNSSTWGWKDKYDKMNNVIEAKQDTIVDPYFIWAEGSHATRYTYIYEFDKSGNWITRKQFESGKLYSITKREIEYY